MGIVRDIYLSRMSIVLSLLGLVSWWLCIVLLGSLLFDSGILYVERTE